MTPRQRAMGLAAVCGSKVTLGPAFLSVSRNKPSAGAWVLAALGEMFVDKIGLLPPRYRPALMVPRALAGAYVAHQSLKEDGVDDPATVAAAAVAAAGVAGLAPILRIALNTGLRVPDALVGVAEDALFLRFGAHTTGMTMEGVQDAARCAVNEAVEDLMEAIAVGDEAEALGVA